MLRTAWLAAACALVLVAAPARADEPKAARKAKPVERLLAELHETEAKYGDKDIPTTPLFELLDELAKNHNVAFSINDERFTAAGIANVRDYKARFTAAQLRGVTLHQFLAMVLDGARATYLVRPNYIEIVPLSDWTFPSSLSLDSDEFGPEGERVPLVSAVIKDRSLGEALAQIGERFDLTIVVTTQANVPNSPISARLLNMPADKAIELLALQSDLRVVRKGQAYLVTSKKHADALLGEKQDRERTRLELDKLREAPAVPLKP